jgi:hypothetical protein
MIRLLAAVVAVAVYAAPLAVLPMAVTALVGLAPLAVVAAAIAGRWRPPATAGACLFAVEYATALWVAGRPVDVFGAAAFGLAVLVLLEAVDLACRTRGATLGPGVVRAQVARWTALALVTLASAALATTLAVPLASAVPGAAAPLVAAAGALGVIGVLARGVVGASRGSGAPGAAPTAGQPGA